MTASPRRRYRFRDYLAPKVLVMLALGFSSGLPFVLVGNTFAYWLRDEHTSLAAIGFLSWVGLAYSLKFVWAPLLDRLRIPGFGHLGQRRGWIALMQILVAAGLVAMALSGTAHGLAQLGVCALAVAFSSATQDTAIDAWRIETAKDKDELGLLTSAYTFGYRTALLVSEAVILPIAQRIGWNQAYMAYGAVMAALLIATFFAAEPVRGEQVLAEKQKDAPLWTPRGLSDAVIGPFIAFFRAVMPALAGTVRMPYLRFLAYNAAGGIVWGVGFVLLGYLAGNSYQRVVKTVGTTATIVAVVLLLLPVVIWRIRRHWRHDESSD